ncbi:lipocalin family protein [Labilibaculum manganireducens]|uniref:lipocalin family protein n=1 Tax=Labilibaculum manganireducens TaxID=1940525 RepID=UPI0029F4E37A|nr:lipocalin family protein [Labilibaculum manganireducens]
MKRITLLFLTIASAALFSTSCTEEEVHPSFDQSLIIGTWESGTWQSSTWQSDSIFERYDRGNTGATWDVKDDVTEAEAQKFTWTIEKDVLEQIHIIENGGVSPRVYTITVLTASTLEYKDEKSGTTTSFIKQ